MGETATRRTASSISLRGWYRGNDGLHDDRGSRVLSDYLPIVLMAGGAGGVPGVSRLVFAVVSILVSHALRPNHPTPVNLSAYDCGNDPVRLPKGERFSVKFYVVA